MSGIKGEWKLTEDGNVIAIHPGFQTIMKVARKFAVERRSGLKLYRGDDMTGWFDDKGNLRLVARLET
jgi:hypothetical protein